MILSQLALITGVFTVICEFDALYVIKMHTHPKKGETNHEWYRTARGISTFNTGNARTPACV